MRGDRFSLVAGLVVIASLLLAGCSHEEPTTPAAPAPTAVSPSPTPTAETTADPYAIPDDPADIDEAYVERVLEALNLSLVEATRIVATEQRVTAEVKEALAATHLSAAGRGYLRVFREFLSPEGPGVEFRKNPEAVDIVTVEKVISASATCVFALVEQDSSGLVEGGADPFPVYYHLKVKDIPAPSDGNPTPWMIARDAQPLADAEYEDPCKGS